MNNLATVFKIHQEGGNALIQLEKAYSAGENNLLSSIANAKLLELEETNKVLYSQKTKNQFDKLSSIYERLIQNWDHDEEMRKFFNDCESEINHLCSSTSTDTFIQGFLEGYKFFSILNTGEAEQNA